MEMITGVLTLDAEAAGVKSAAGQAALDLLAAAHVFTLNLVRPFEAFRAKLTVGCGEIAIENYAAAVGSERQHDVGVHQTVVHIKHEIRKDEPVLRLPGANIACRCGHRPGLYAAPCERVGLILRIVEHSTQCGMDRVDVV